MKTRSKKANFLAYVLLLLTALAGTASADVVTDWNVIGLGEAVAAGRQGGAPAIDLATMHAAMYDAVQAIEKDYEPYRVTDVPNATGSPVAAAAKAARDVLVARFPLRAGAINTLYVNYLNDHFIDPSDPGIAVGAYVATKLLAYRACDGSLPIPAPTFIGGMGIGEWRPTPLMAFAAMNPGPYLGQVTPFFMTRPTQFRPDPPPAVTSKQYARDYEEVKLYGAKTGSLRSPEQTDQAFFWAGNTFAAIYSGVRNVAANNVDNVSDSSRLFALVAMSQADTLIGVWDAKFHYNYWRPITAIQNGAVDGNADTVGDGAWESLIINPAYPDYTSGANGVSSSTLYSMEHFFETDSMEFSMTSTNGTATQNPRNFTSFSQAIQEVVDGRILLGIHFRFADEASVKLGHDVVKWGYKNYLRPVKGAEN